MEELKTQIAELQAQMDKQRLMLAETAQQLIQLQVKETQKEIRDIPTPSNAISGDSDGLDSADFATNEDLVQLVAELQGQLTLLDDKSIIRTCNSHVVEDTDPIEPLPNLDGTLPDDFPKIVAEFTSLGDDSIVQLARFYELVPPNVEEQAKWDLYLNGQSNSSELKEDEILIGAEGIDENTILGLWNQLAIFLGVSHLKRDI